MVRTKEKAFKEAAIYKSVHRLKRNPQGTVRHPGANSGNLLFPLHQKGQGKRLLPELMRTVVPEGHGLTVGTVVFMKRKYPLPNCDPEGDTRR